MKTLNGGVIAGGSGKNERVENDFYATNPEALEKLLNVFNFIKNDSVVLEPCVGQGHLANVLQKHTKYIVECVDIEDRGYPNTIIANYITQYVPQTHFDCIVTNPPFSLAEEFIRTSFCHINPNGIIAMFLKIQFLEGSKRKDFFDKFPPKYIYVFRKRMATFNNGNEKDENGKRWATTMCHAWFIWENGFTGEPIIRWLD